MHNIASRIANLQKCGAIYLYIWKKYQFGINYGMKKSLTQVDNAD